MENNPNEAKIQPIKSLRMEIDSCILGLEKRIAEHGESRALSIVKTKLEEAKMWCGKRLEELGSTLPAEYQDKAEVRTSDSAQETAAAPPEKPKDKRVVRTKSTGDRVYFLDEIKKTRQWIFSPEVLSSLGFQMGDVQEIEDTELLKYNMGPGLTKPIERDET